MHQNLFPHRRVTIGVAAFVVLTLGIAVQFLASSIWPDPVSADGPDVGDGQVTYLRGDGLQPLIEGTIGSRIANVHGPGGQIVAQAAADGPDAQMLLVDHLGSTRVVGDHEGNAWVRYEYAPYGKTMGMETGTAYRYTGHPYDPRQVLYQTPVRNYDPSLGEFLSVDPQRQGASPYPYAGNDPIGYVDLTGGVRVPYFMKSGWKKPERYLSRSTAELFGIHQDQRIGLISSFKKGPQLQRSTSRVSVTRFLYGQGKVKKRAYQYNDEFFWIMGDREGVPDDLYETLRLVRDRRPKFGKKMVLLNFHSEEHGAKIQSELDAAGQSNLLITSKLIPDVDTQSKANLPLPRAYEVAGKQLSPDEFGAYVRGQMADKWPRFKVSIELSKLPTETGPSVSDPHPAGPGWGNRDPTHWAAPPPGHPRHRCHLSHPSRMSPITSPRRGYCRRYRTSLRRRRMNWDWARVSRGSISSSNHNDRGHRHSNRPRSALVDRAIASCGNRYNQRTRTFCALILPVRNYLKR